MNAACRARLTSLEGSVIYNVYPQSFCDSDGDGIGDLNGLTRKLSYLAGLGVDIIWVNPIYPSPFRDAGYDVTDFCDIAPRYGTMADFGELIAAAHSKGIRIVLDLVAGHTSNEHAWFQESCRDQANGKANWYIWSDRTFDSGGGADGFISGYAAREGRYRANFFYFQPALNYGYANPEFRWQLPLDHSDVLDVKRAMRDVMAFWLSRGVAGFRVDMADSLVKSDPTGEGITAYWRETRNWLDEVFPEALLISEWSDPTKSIASGFDVDFLIHTGTAIATKLLRAEEGRNVVAGRGHSYFDRSGCGNIDEFFEPYLKAWDETRSLGMISLPTGSHDLPRFSEGRDVNDLKIIFAFQMTLPGIPTIYYGDEIGMRNLPFVPNTEGGFNRTQARTPMQWDGSANAGFSSAKTEKLYLPIDPDDHRPTVENQLGVVGSLHEHVRNLISFRKEKSALFTNGSLEILHGGPQSPVLVYLRRSEVDQVLILLNPNSQPEEISLEGLKIRHWRARFSSHDRLQSIEVSYGTQISLPGVCFAILVPKVCQHG